MLRNVRSIGLRQQTSCSLSKKLQGLLSGHLHMEAGIRLHLSRGLWQSSSILMEGMQLTFTGGVACAQSSLRKHAEQMNHQIRTQKAKGSSYT